VVGEFVLYTYPSPKSHLMRLGIVELVLVKVAFVFRHTDAGIVIRLLKVTTS
jgi:hypothetical protein